MSATDQPAPIINDNPYKEIHCVEIVKGFHPAYLLNRGNQIFVRGTDRRGDAGRVLVVEILAEGREPSECRVDMRTGLIQEYIGLIQIPLRSDPVRVRYEHIDFQKTPGGPVPHRMIGYQDGRKVIELRFTLIDLDTSVELSVFNVPLDHSVRP